MTRYNILLGRNELLFVHAGFGNQQQIKCDVVLDGKAIETLLSEFDGENYKFFEVQKLLPPSQLALPLFINGFDIINNAIKPLSLTFYQGTAMVTENYKVLLSAGTRRAGQSLRPFTTLVAPFLTNQPMNKKTTFLSEEWFYWLNNFSPNFKKIGLFVVATFENGTILSDNIVLIENPENEAVYCFDVSVGTINVFFNNPNRLVNYTIEVKNIPIGTQADALLNTATAFSEKRYFEVIPTVLTDMYFVFKNSFGFFDTLRLTGNQKQSQELEGLTFENNTGVFTADVTYFRKLIATIGEMEQGWLPYLQELTISKEIYLRVSQGYQQLICLTKSLSFYESAKAFDEATLEFRFIENEVNF